MTLSSECGAAHQIMHTHNTKRTGGHTHAHTHTHLYVFIVNYEHHDVAVYFEDYHSESYRVYKRWIL